MAVATLAEPALTITNISKVDDAGSVHFESVWTAQFIKSLVDDGLLKFQGNIRPDHMEGQRMGTKTRRKIEKWAMELLAGNAVIGNLSVRVNPDAALLETEVDDDGQESLIIQRGHLDTAVDSESRLKAIIKALNSPMGDRLKDARFAVRIWVVNDTTAKRVAANYNTRGEKVNDSAAKFAWQETAGQRLARRLVDGTPHLGIDNVEVLSNTVSANSPKLATFNTFARGLELYWHGEPLNEDEEREQAAFLVRFWNELVGVRPEYGRLTKAARQQARKRSVSGTAVSIHGLIAAASELHRSGTDSGTDIGSVLKPMSEAVVVDGKSVDYFSYDNPVWTKLGVLAVGRENDKGEPTLGIRTTFQTRDAMADELVHKLGLTVSGAIRQK